MRALSYLLVFLFLGTPLSAQDKPKRLSNLQIKKRLIRESIESYDGNCPCPYSRTSRGHRCGKRSAWSKPGGEDPLCYVRDVSDEMVEAYRRRQQQNTFPR